MTKMSKESPRTRESSSSSIYNIIPSAVRSRIPVPASLCRSARSVASKPSLASKSWSWSAEEHISSSTPSNQSRRTSISSTVGTVSVTTSGTAAPGLDASENGQQALVAATQFDASMVPRGIGIGGIDWVIAGAGIRLWLHAREQTESSTRDPALLRSMHIDAIKYMNLALPADLSTREIETIQSSLPSQVMQSAQSSGNAVVVLKPSILRRTVAQAVCWTVAIVLMLIPLLMTAINRILIYEREHRITRRMIDSGANLTKALGERGVDCGEAFIRFKDSPLGKACLQTSSWIIEGVVGGLNDGFVQSTSGRGWVVEQRSS